MKIIRIDSDNNACLIADSAWRPHRRPYFVPDGQNITCQVRPALRIDRLGKAINPKFATRYIGAWSPVCCMLAAADYQNLAPAGMLDDSIVIGEWLPLPQGEVCMELNGGTAHWEFKADIASELIARLSQAATFKTGDIIILPQTLFRFVPVAGTSVSLTVSDSKILEFNIR